MANVTHSFRSVIVLILALFVLAGCKNNGSDDAAKKDSDSTASATAPEEKGDNGDKAEEPVEKVAPDIYPEFPLGQFNDKERAQVVKITKAELCPCEESTESLHQCLQSKEKRCALAEQALNMVGGMVKAAYTETDVLDEVAKFVEAAKKTHEFKLEGRPFKGGADAKVVIVEFADFECPACKAASGMVKNVSDKYGDKIKIVFKQYPLPSHQNAPLAARAAIAAHQQGKFWPMHDELFKNQRSLSFDKIVNLAQRLGLNIGKFKTDLESPDVRQIVADDRVDGDNSGLTGTPTFYINGKRFLGGGGEDAMHQAIDAALAEANAEGTTTEE